MRRNVIYFSPKDSIFEIARVLSRENISGAPVIDGGKVTGVISETDIVRFMKIKLPKFRLATEEPHVLALLTAELVKEEVEFVREIKKIARTEVGDFMSKDIISVSPESTLLEAAEVMENKKVSRLPVIASGRLVGMISRIDLIKALVE